MTLRSSCAKWCPKSFMRINSFYTTTATTSTTTSNVTTSFCTVIISTVQMRILRHREVKEHSQGHTAKTWHSWDSSLCPGRAVFFRSEASGIKQHSHARPLPSLSGAQGPPPAVTVLTFPRGLGDTWEKGEPPCGERGNLSTRAFFPVYTPPSQSCILVSRVLKVETHLSFSLFYRKIFKF